MLKICVYTFLLSSALSDVEMTKPLKIKGCVGENVTFKCSDWHTRSGKRTHDKYFCDSPCTDDNHIIVRAAFRETKQNNRIKITNREEGLIVTFTNLQKSDSKTYYCGLERHHRDSYIMVNLKVTDASPKTTPKPAVVGSTLSFAVTNSPSMSSSRSDIITDMSASYTTIYSTTTTRRVDYVPYLIAGFIFIITTVMVGMILTRKMMKKQQLVIRTPQEDTRESAGPDEVYQSLHTLTMDKDQVYSTLTPTERSAGPDEVYQSLHTLMMDKDQVYSTLTPTERSAGPDEVYQSLHTLTMDKDQVYSTLTPTERV